MIDRHELKFETSWSELAKIFYRLRLLMQADKHQSDDGYVIRSLYFDDLYDSGMSENEAGIEKRSKYRIRMYNQNPDLIRLEKKSKRHSMTQKTDCMLTQDEVCRILEGDVDFLAQKESKVGQEFYVLTRTRGLRAICIVEYNRYALVEETGNVRVTFDCYVRGSNETDSFFSKEAGCIPVMEEGRHILEIKYDELLPQYILQAVDLNELHRQSFSKYYRTRRVLG